ncbi:FIMAH domain-containing protein [Micromonospora rhizosphaerae]|uniref:FIMAH domain-containing protein n=1 Tax=Micromonospora rhizosphaerae TaxID=568872 RepID=UPI00114CB8E0|nr:hypothetical protein [Micromonospora rhizosphaerae]
MSVIPDPPSAERAWPTAPLPQVRAGRSRHRAPDDGRRLMWVTVTGAVVVVVVVAVMMAFDGGGGGAGPAVLATPGETAAAEATEAPVVGDPSASPTVSPSAKPSPRPGQRAANLVAGMQAAVRGLVQQGQLSRDAGNELGRRLRDVEQALSGGDAARAREKLREFGERLVNIRRKNKISSSGYDTLASLATQLAQALPNR